MRRIIGPTPFLGGLSPIHLRRLKAPRPKTLQEITGGLIWDHPEVILRPQDRRRMSKYPPHVMPKIRRARMISELGRVDRFRAERVERKYFEGLGFSQAIEDVRLYS